MNQTMIDDIINDSDTPYTHTDEHAALCEYGDTYHIHIPPLPEKDLNIWCIANGYIQQRCTHYGFEFVTVIKKG